jgi:wyosine [tRNA(Phe)-imidazoG37] synthetase (radical SAM superfamily)
MKVNGLLSHVIFGPVASRRYGVSLGVNLLPAARKVCSFDCPYCECGRTDRAFSQSPPPGVFPPAEGVAAALARALSEARASGRRIDAVTLAGNGEPTLHPDFLDLMKTMAEVRDRLAPEARLIALTNGSTLDREPVREGLMIADERIVKLDAATDAMLARLNSPLCRLTVGSLAANLALLPAFATQTMFIQGSVDNTQDDHVAAWIELVGRVQPTFAQVYSTDRRPADPSVRQVPRERLEAIARALTERTGVPARVYA